MKRDILYDRRRSSRGLDVFVMITPHVKLAPAAPARDIFALFHVVDYEYRTRISAVLVDAHPAT